MCSGFEDFQRSNQALAERKAVDDKNLNRTFLLLAPREGLGLNHIVTTFT